VVALAVALLVQACASAQLLLAPALVVVFVRLCLVAHHQNPLGLVGLDRWRDT
jgi:hypothetical protein